MNVENLCPGCMKEVADKEYTAKCPYCGYDLADIHNDVHQLKPFTILNGKYLVGRVIGEGGFGITYLGFDLNLEITLAIKEFYPNGFVTREASYTTAVTSYVGKNQSEFNKWRDNFLKEARSLAKFSNLPGIVEVRDFFSENNTVYIVMEYVEGITLKEYLKQQGGRIPTDVTFQLIEPVMTSLQKVHEMGIIHRDISPDNIMISKQGGMKLLDFGAARDISPNAEKSLSVLLKPGYAPEEQYRTRGNQGSWSDVYALTATIYKCLTGVTPVEAMERMRQDSLVSPTSMGISLTAEQEKALQKGMAVYAEQRFQTMEELHEALYHGKIIENPAGTGNEVTVPFMAPIENVETKPEKDSGTNNLPDIPKLNLDNKKTAVIVGTAAVVLLLVAALVIGSSGRKKDVQVAERETVETVDTSDESGEDETAANIENDRMLEENNQKLKEAVALTEENRGEAMAMLTEVMDTYIEVGKQDGYFEDAQDGITEAMQSYWNATLAQIEMLKKQGIGKDLYIQMNLDLDAAEEVYLNVQKSGYAVLAGNSELIQEIQAEREALSDEYRRRYISDFDQFMDGYQWPPREAYSLISDAFELFPSEDPDDAIRLRYAYAYAWYIHQNNVEKIETGEISSYGAVENIVTNLEETDYNEFLMQEAEAYAWNSQERWINSDYFQVEYYLPIIADSSTREYSMEDIYRLGLSASQLRYARYEIYARHDMQTWDINANGMLGVEEGTPSHKFMSYNDFGEFATDGMNGLTITERHNIRNLVRVELENGDFVW